MIVPDWLKRARERLDQRATGAPALDVAVHASADTSASARWGHRALWIGLILFLAWGAFAPLGQGVPAHGFVKVEGNRKTIQHLRGGVVEEILVNEGDRVEANQPLIRLNEAQVQAQQGSLDSQLVSVLAVEARLRAELAGSEQIKFPAFLVERRAAVEARESMQVQEHLFRTRRAALEGEISIGLENIAGLEEQILGLQAQEKSKQEQLRLFKEELDTLRPLYEQGFVPRNRMFELERAIAFTSGQRSEDIANIGRSKSQISELRLRILKVRNDYRKEVETQLTDAQRQASDLKEKRVATQDDLDRIVLRAPLAGIVVDLSVHTVGGVVSPGQKLMDIVPAGENLLVEIQIPPHLIDNVHAGLETDIRFTALDQTIIPAVPGTLAYVSADRVTDAKTDQPYFIGRVQPTAEGIAKLGKHVLLLGMPAEVVIKTGQRSFFGYLLRPLLVRMQFAFKER